MIAARTFDLTMVAGIFLAGVVLWRMISASRTERIRRLRWIVAAIAAYGALSFVHAAWSGTSLHDAVTGDGLFRVLPFVVQGTFLGAFLILPLGWIVSVVRAGFPRLRVGSPGPAVVQAIALTACTALLFTSLPQKTEFSSPRKTPQQRGAELDKSLSAIANGERYAPRDRWDPDYVVSKVGHEPQKLFGWVQNNTYWIPYHGVLRGPVGVLMDSQGNSLDRALLLATLLEKAGQTVRLAHGELTREAAVAILLNLVSERAVGFWAPARTDSLPEPDVRAAALQYTLNGATDQTLKSPQQAAARMQSQLSARVSDQSQRLLRAAAPQNAEDEWARRFEASLAALRDHWWVQRQDGSKWVDLDLLAGDGTTGAALAPAKETPAVNNIAADLYHQIAIRVIAEQWSSGTVNEHKVLEYVLRPANLIGQPIVLQFMPTEWLDSVPVARPAADIRSAVLAQREWAAGLAVGREDVASAILRDSGDDSNAGKGGAGSAGGAGGGPFGALGAALDNTLNRREDTSQNKVLSAVSIEYEIKAPVERPRTIRRTVFDLLGPTARASGNPQLQLDNIKKLTRGLALTMRTDILPVVCQLAPEFVAHLAAESLTDNAELLHDITTNDFSPYSNRSQQQMARAKPPVTALLTLAFTRLEWNRSAGHIFLDRPNLLTGYESLVNTRDGIVLRDAIDIVANEVAVDLTAHDGFATRLQQGVRDTNGEALLIAPGATGNAGEAFAESHDWLSIAPAQRSALDSLSFPEDTRRRMAQDLDAGYVLVAPRAPVQRRNENFAGWWRIDPQTGDVLGVGDNGWGQAAEYGRQMNLAFTFSRSFVFEYALCQSFPLAVNSIKIINEELFGGWNPGWTAPATRSRDPIEMADANMHMCIVQAIAAGFAATLPLLLMTWKVSEPARGMAFVKRVIATEEEVSEASRVARPCIGLGPMPSRIPLAVFLAHSQVALFFQNPCGVGGGGGPRDTLPDPNEYGPYRTIVEPPEPSTVRIPGVTHAPTDYEVVQAYEALKRAEMKLLPEVKELCQYMGQPVGRDAVVELALRERAETTFFEEYTPAVDRYLTLRKLRDFFNGK